MNDEREHRARLVDSAVDDLIHAQHHLEWAMQKLDAARYDKLSRRCEGMALNINALRSATAQELERLSQPPTVIDTKESEA